MHCWSYCRCINLVGVKLECLLLFLLVGKESCCVRHDVKDNLLLQYYYPDVMLVPPSRGGRPKTQSKERGNGGGLALLALSLPPSNSVNRF